LENEKRRKLCRFFIAKMSLLKIVYHSKNTWKKIDNLIKRRLFRMISVYFTLLHEYPETG